MSQRRRRTRPHESAPQKHPALFLFTLVALIAVPLLVPAFSPGTPATPATSAAPVAARGAMRIPNLNNPAEPYRAEWNGRLAAARQD